MRAAAAAEMEDQVAIAAADRPEDAVAVVPVLAAAAGAVAKVVVAREGKELKAAAEAASV
jgi:hypothetical protein